MEYCCNSPLKIILNGLRERKNSVGPTSLNIYKYDNSYVKTLIFVVAHRLRCIFIVDGFPDMTKYEVWKMCL